MTDKTGGPAFPCKASMRPGQKPPENGTVRNALPDSSFAHDCER